jgi:hypothetical protein
LEKNKNMKKYFLVAMVCLVVSTYVSAQTAAKVSGPAITWVKSAHNFGDINQGDKVQQVFAFTNTGNEPLIISNVQVTCGCTVPEWPKDPIAPGGKSQITVAFNSTGKMGMQNKTVTVVSNAVGDSNQITFTANVLEKKQQPQ